MKSNRQLAPIVAIGLLAVIASSQAQDHSTDLPSSDGTPITLSSGQPAPDHYGPVPAFDKLDIDHDGNISRAEAEAYIPLFNDFDFIAHHAERISKQQFVHWVRTQTR